MLGCTREELLGRRITDTVAERERPRVTLEVAKVLGGQLHMSEWSFLRQDGSAFRGEVYARLLPDGQLLLAMRDGLFEPAFAPGDEVELGAHAGAIHSIHEPERPAGDLRFPASGVVLARGNRGLVKRGEMLAMIAQDVRT